MSGPHDPELRIGDDERETAVTALGDHYAAGRLTKDEYDERAAQAWAARTRSALWPLFADLPRPEPVPSAGPPADDHRGHPGAFGGLGSGHRQSWWFGARTLPVILIVLGLVLLTKLPWFVLLIVVWLVWTRMLRLWGFAAFRRRHPHTHQHPHHQPGRW